MAFKLGRARSWVKGRKSTGRSYIINNKMEFLTDEQLQSVARVNVDDYCIADSSFLCNGGWGGVYSVKRKCRPGRVAMKFFGYTKQSPALSSIHREIVLMNALRGVEGVVQLVGIFDDTKSGLVPNKNPLYLEQYPVIVMELLDGGSLFDRVSRRNAIGKQLSEHDLAVSFRSAVEAVLSVHEHGYLHRDLKLDNMVFISPVEGAQIKLIDFGYMCELPAVGGIVHDHLLGTEGCFAPESIMRMEYSAKTDVFQAGCVLYTLLAGHPPFHADRKRRMDIVNKGYYPLRGVVWANISESAKNLVAGMLHKNPLERLSVRDVLKHEWIGGAASSKSLGDEYAQRIKRLSLRHQLKKCFLACHMEEGHRQRQASLKEELSHLAGHASEQNGALDLYACVSSSLGAIYVGESMSEKLRDLKNMLVNTIYGNRFENSDNINTDEDEDGPRRPSKKMRLGFDGKVDYSVFCNFVCSCDLEILASQHVFSIFDANGDGNICMREFLMTIMAMREMGSDQDDVEAAQLYFRMFDIDEDGYIGIEELELVIGCLLHDGTGLLVVDENDINSIHIEEMFNAIDTNHDGRIDIGEFRMFYETVLLPSSKQSGKTSSLGSTGTGAVVQEPLNDDIISSAFAAQSSVEYGQENWDKSVHVVEVGEMSMSVTSQSTAARLQGTKQNGDQKKERYF